MKYKVIDSNKTICFCRIGLGDLFKCDDNDCYYYIKTVTEYGENGRTNAVCISDGEFACFDDDDKVIPLEYELTIKD